MKTLKTSETERLAYLLTENPSLHFHVEPNPRRPSRLDFLIDADDYTLQLFAKFDTDPDVPIKSFLDRLHQVRDIVMQKRRGQTRNE